MSPEFFRPHWVAAGLAAYLIVCSACSRNPRLALVGAIVFGSGIAAAFSQHAGAIHWALQGGFIFLLLHSLRWNDSEHPGANFIRVMTATLWVVHSFAWMNSDAAKFWMPMIPGATILGVCLACQLHRLEWKKSVLPAAALLVLLAGPCHGVAEGVRSMPAGLLAITGSFLLFGFGTVAALTRRHWHDRKSK